MTVWAWILHCAHTGGCAFGAASVRAGFDTISVLHGRLFSAICVYSMCWHCVCTVQTCFGHCLHVRLCGGTLSVQHAFGAVSAQVCACVFNSVSVWLRVWFTFCAGVCMHVMAVHAYE